MNIVDIELRIENTTRTISRIIRNGRIYVIYVNEKFDVKNRNNLRDLVDALNFELKKDGIDPVEFRKVERDLARLSIGGKGSIKIG